MRRLAILTAVLLSVAACGRDNGVEPRRATPDGQGEHLRLVGERAADLTVLRFEINSGACTNTERPTLGRVDVDESPDAVTVTATVVHPKQDGNAMCAGVGIIIPVTTALKTALGTRRVLDGSCSPPADVLEAGETRQACEPTDRQRAEVNAVGTWHTFDAGPLATRAEAKAVWTGEEMIVLGGDAVEQYVSLADGATYNPATQQWRKIADRPAPGRILGVTWTGKELFALGQANGSALTDARSVHLYNPATNAWREPSAPPHGFGFPSVWWTGHDVLVWQDGGSGSLYNPSTDSWRDIPPADIANSTPGSHAQWLAEAGVLAVQGAQTPASGGPLRSALLLFDPNTGKWRKAAEPPRAIPSFATTSAAWLGADEVFNPADDPAATHALAYDPKLDRWRDLDLATVQRDEGTGYFIGLSIGEGRGVVRVGDSHEPLLLFNSATGTWSHAAAPGGAIPAPDTAIVWTGQDILMWGRPLMAGANAGNAAWRWSP